MVYFLPFLSIFLPEVREFSNHVTHHYDPCKGADLHM